MDVQAITPALATQPLTQAAVSATSFQDVAAAIPSATPAFDVSFTPSATAQAASATDFQAEDAAALAQQALQAQQTVLSALRSGATDVSLLLSGLPPGATATLLGGGWVRVPPGMDPSEVEALWAFHFPFRRQDVPAVTSSTRADPTHDQDKHPAKSEGPLTAYGAHGEQEPVPGQPGGSTLDILD